MLVKDPIIRPNAFDCLNHNFFKISDQQLKQKINSVNLEEILNDYSKKYLIDTNIVSSKDQNESFELFNVFPSIELGFKT